MESTNEEQISFIKEFKITDSDDEDDALPPPPKKCDVYDFIKRTDLPAIKIPKKPNPDAVAKYKTRTMDTDKRPSFLSRAYEAAKPEYNSYIIRLSEKRMSPKEILRHLDKHTGAKLTESALKRILYCSYCSSTHVTSKSCYKKFLATREYFTVNPKYHPIPFETILKTSTTSTGAFKCTLCDYGPVSVSNKDLFEIRCHIASHLARKYLCSICEHAGHYSSFPDKSLVRRHIMSAHQINLEPEKRTC